MCGVAGIFLLSGALPSIETDKAVFAAMRNRGPDSHGKYDARSSRGLGRLYHTRLSIVDIDERSNQPFEIDGHAIAFNGEIYNYKSLRSDLRSRGVHFKTDSDTEVLIRGLMVEGCEFIKKLRGMWAFIYHVQASGQTFVSRDHTGQKPLYYRKEQGRLILASNFRAVVLLNEAASETPATALKRI